MEMKNLVSLIPLIQGELTGNRHEIHEIIVKRVLSKKEINDIFTVNELKEEILKNFNFENFPDELLDKILVNLVKNNYLRLNDNNYKLIKNFDYKNIDLIIDECYKDFIDFIKIKIKDFDPFIHKNMKLIFKECLYEIVRVFSEQDDFYQTQIETLHQNLIEGNLIKIAKNNDLNSPKKLVSIFFDYIKSGNEKITDFIFISYRVAITYDLLKKGSDLSLESCDLGQGGTLLLDTNAIISLICKTDSKHKLIDSTVKLSKKLKCEVCFSKMTKIEYGRLLKGANSQMTIRSLNRGNLISDNQIVKDFIRQKKGTWGDYYTEISNIELYLRLQYEINLVEYDDFIPDEKIMDYLYVIFPSVLNSLSKEKTKEAIEHDIYLFSLTSYLRDNEPNMVFNCPWILSFDYALSFINTLLIQRFEFTYGFVIHPKYWLDTLLTFSNVEIDETNKKEIVKAILEHMVIPEKNINIDDYARLITNKIGLNEDDEEIIKYIFSMSPLKRNLDLALESNDIESVSKITCEIFIDSDLIDKVIAERETKNENVRLKKQLANASEKYRIEKAKSYLLEEVVTKQFAEPRIIIDDVDPNISKMVEALTDRLDQIDEHFFEQNQIPKLESGRISKENAISTLEKISKTIRQSKVIVQEMKDLIQHVPTIIGLLNS